MSRLRKTRSAAAINNVSQDVDFDSDPSEDYASSDSEDDPLSLKTDFTTVAKRLTLHGLDSITKGDYSLETQTRYYGRSSSYHLVSTTRELRKMHINDMIGDNEDKLNAETARRRIIERGSLRREEFWKAPPVSSLYYIHTFSLPITEHPADRSLLDVVAPFAIFLLHFMMLMLMSRGLMSITLILS